LPALFTDQTDFVAQRRQPLIGIVLAQDQTVFGAGCHHAVGLCRAASDEIINQNADISLGTINNDRLLACQLAYGIDTGDQSLAGCFLIAG
jgi:hypothetical protein